MRSDVQLQIIRLANALSMLCCNECLASLEIRVGQMPEISALFSNFEHKSGKIWTYFKYPSFLSAYMIFFCPWNGFFAFFAFFAFLWFCLCSIENILTLLSHMRSTFSWIFECGLFAIWVRNVRTCVWRYFRLHSKNSLHTLLPLVAKWVENFDTSSLQINWVKIFGEFDISTWEYPNFSTPSYVVIAVLRTS